MYEHFKVIEDAFALMPANVLLIPTNASGCKLERSFAEILLPI